MSQRATPRLTQRDLFLFGPIATAFLLGGVILSLANHNLVWFWCALGFVMVAMVVMVFQIIRDSKEFSADDFDGTVPGDQDPAADQDNSLADEIFGELLEQDAKQEPKYVAGHRRFDHHMDGEGNRWPR